MSQMSVHSLCADKLLSYICHWEERFLIELFKFKCMEPHMLDWVNEMLRNEVLHMSMDVNENIHIWGLKGHKHLASRESVWINGKYVHFYSCTCIVLFTLGYVIFYNIQQKQIQYSYTSFGNTFTLYFKLGLISITQIREEI